MSGISGFYLPSGAVACRECLRKPRYRFTEIARVISTEKGRALRCSLCGEPLVKGTSNA